MKTRAVGTRALVLGTAILLDASVSAAQGWQFVEPMPTARSYHASATMGDRWYVAGGASWFGTMPDGGSERFRAEVDTYDPTSGHWAALGNLTQGREYLLAIGDPSRGRVLFLGGFLPAGPLAYLPLPTCDIAASGGVSPAPNLLKARHLHAGALAGGKLVITGGRGDSSNGEQLLDDAEAWDGTSPVWMAAGRMPAGYRAGHTMTTLQNGREVLVAGGGLPDHAMSEVDLFDTACGTWSSVMRLRTARVAHKALLLTDGRVLVVGGDTYPPTFNNVLTSAELFDPATRAWKPAASMKDPRFDFDMVLLPDGRVLAAGGSNNATDGEYGALSSAEVYDPVADTWTSLPPMHDRRRRLTLAVLSDGVYVAGGSYAESTVPGSATVLASVERLAWSDLGITGPIDLDAGVPGESPPDASISCPSDDAGAGGDGSADVRPTDGAGDASQSGDATDAPVVDGGSSDRETGGGKSGCSCSLISADDSLAGLALASFVLGAALRRRCRRLSPNDSPRT